MYTTVVCPGCDQEQRIFTRSLGKQIRCRFCATKFVAGAADSPAPRADDLPAVPHTRPSAARRGEPLEVFPVTGEEGEEAIAPTARSAPALERLQVRPIKRPRPPQKLHRHARPWYLFLFALFPLAVLPLAFGAARLRGQEMGGLGIALWGALGLGLFGLCLGLALRGSWSVVGRVLGSLGLIGVGYLAVIGAFLVGLFASLGNTGPAAWQDYAPPAGRCTILMPGTPKAHTEKVATAAGQLDYQQFGVERNWGRVAYVVAFSDLPFGALQRGADQDILNGMRDGAVEGLKGRVVSEKQISLDGHLGKEIEVKLGSKGDLWARHYVVRQRLYQVMVVSTTGTPPPAEDMKKFFDSFKLIDTPPARGAVVVQKPPVPPPPPKPVDPPKPPPGPPKPPPQPKPAPSPPPPSYYPPPVVPVVIKPPALEQDKVDIPLPSEIGDLAVGGGGRYLILHLPKLHRLAVFDVNEAKVVRDIPTAPDKVLIAAGMDKLIVVRPATHTLERWSLTTFSRETETRVAMVVPPVAAAMGSASGGPLVISGCDWPRLGETVFFDIVAMKRLETSVKPHAGFHTSPSVFLRASANGRVFACQANGGPQTCVLEGGDVLKFEGSAGRFPVPGPDGTVLYTAQGRFTPQGKPVPGDHFRCLPAHHGPFYLSFPGPQGPKGRIGVHLAGDNRPLVFLPDIEGIETLDKGDPHRLTLDKRVHFLPDARLVITIPASNDRLVLHRFDLEEALAKADINYVIVTSQPPLTVRRGQTHRYPLAVKSRRDGLTYRVEAGPPGVQVSPQGVVTWPVPADFVGHEAEIALAVRDNSGQECTHRYPLAVTGGNDLSGDALVYLADLEAAEVQQGPWPLGRGHMGTPERGAITVNGKRAPKGLGLHVGHPFSAVTYRLNRQFRQLAATVALNDSSEPTVAGVEFEVLGDGKSLWRSRLIQNRGVTDSCKVDVTGVDLLELRINLKGSHYGAHTVWVEPYVTKGGAGP